VVSKDPVGAGLRMILRQLQAAEIVADIADADVLLAYGREDVFKALEESTLPVWQVSQLKERYINARVRHFDIFDELMPRLQAALNE